MTLHPLTRLVVGLVCLVEVIMRADVGLSVAVFGLVECLLAWRMAVLPRFLGTCARLLLPVAVSAALMQGFFPGTDTPTPWPLALSLFCRIVAGLGGMVLLFVSTRPSDLALGLEQKGLPTAASYLIAASFQLVPGMAARVQRVRNSLQARGADFQAVWWRRLPLLTSLAVPVIVCELLAADQRAATLMARGFGMAGPKTAWRILPEQAWEPITRWILSLGCAADLYVHCLLAWGFMR